MPKNKKLTKLFVRVIVFSLLFGLVVGFSFWIGVNDNPNFTVEDFFMNFSSDLLGMLFALLIVDRATQFDKEYRQERKRLKEKVQQPEMPEVGFEIIDGTGMGSVQSVSTLRDKQTGIHYVFVTGENGSALTPLLDKEGRPVQSGLKVDKTPVGESEG